MAGTGGARRGAYRKACPIAFWVGDLAAAEHYAAMLLDHSTRHPSARWRAFGRSHQGVLAVKRGDLVTLITAAARGL